MIKLEIEKGIDIMKSFDYKTILKWIFPILICLSSFCMVAQKTSTPNQHLSFMNNPFNIWMKKEIQS